MNCFVKESYGVIWHFYHNSHGICFCKMKNENITEYQVLLPEGREDFDIIVDDSDCIHLVCQNTNGDILYLNHFNEQWRKATLLKSKTPTHYLKNFVLKRVNNWLNLFYCIEYNGKRMLTHQIIDNTDGTPYVIDSIKGDFCVSQDACGNLYLLFYSETEKCYGTKKYIWSKKEWLDFQHINDMENCTSSFLYVDSEDKIHVLYDSNYEIIEYFENKSNMIGVGKNPIMFHQHYDMIMWEGISDNKIYIKKYNENTPSIFMPGGFSKPVPYKLRYTSYEPDLNADYCLGNIVNGAVKTYGINNFFVVSEKPVVNSDSKENTQNENNGLYIELQKLKIQISQLNIIIEKLQAKIDSIDTEKINRRLNEIETTVNKNNKPKLFNLL